MSCRRTAGFTLLEGAMAIAVVAVFGALALPTLGARLQHERLNRAAQALAGDIAEARVLATARQLPIHIDGRAGGAGEGWCWGVSVSRDCACGGNGPAPVCRIRSGSAADYAGVRLLQAPAMQLEAGGHGLVAVAAAFETAQGERLRVDVSARGRPRVCAAAGYWPRLPACQ